MKKMLVLFWEFLGKESTPGMHGTWRVGGVSAEIRRKECAGFLKRLNEESLFLEEKGPRGKGNLEQDGGL